MNGFQILMATLAVNAIVLGAAFLVIYQFNKAVSQCGR